MLPPGAPMSGLKSSSAVGPKELNVLTSPAVGFGVLTSWSVHVRDVGSSPAMVVPLASVSATTGMVIGGVPATVGLMKPATLLYSTTAVAPPAWAFAAFW